jgi:hypothetical protein
MVESIAKGGQAHVFLAKYTRQPDGLKQDAVVKRYKGRLGVRAVHELRWRIENMDPKWWGGGLCRLIGLSEDNITGEVSVVMEAYRGDLRNLIDKRMDYLKSRMRTNTQDDDTTQMMMMPFRSDSTLRMMKMIVCGMEYHCVRLESYTETSKPPTSLCRQLILTRRVYFEFIILEKSN